MNLNLKRSVLSVLFVLSLVSHACNRGSGGGSVVAQVSVKEAEGLIRNDFAVLVDVREDDEIKSGMAAPARWFPTSKIEADDPSWKEFVSKLPKDKQIVFYCAAGVRAGQAAAKLAGQGFKVGNMGGFKDWKAAGLPVKQP